MNHLEKGIGLLTTCLFVSLTSFAMTPNQNLLKGFFIGGDLGMGVIAAQDKQTLDTSIGTMPAVNRGQTANMTSFGGAFIYGLSIGYSLPLGESNALEPTITYNRLSGTVKSSWGPNENVTGDGGMNDLSINISPYSTLKQQLNFLLSFKKQLMQNIALGVGIGASQLLANTGIDYQTVAAGNMSNAKAGPNFVDKHRYIWGPAISLDLQWLLNRHNSLVFTFSDQFYPDKKLPDAKRSVIDSALTSSLKRSVVLNLSAFTLQYRYYF